MTDKDASGGYVLGLTGPLLKVAASSRGAWRIARKGSLQTALSKAVLRRTVSKCHQILRQGTAKFNRRMQKTSSPMVWEG